MFFKKSRFFLSLLFGFIFVTVAGSSDVNSVSASGKNLKVDISSFIEAGCVQEGDKLDCSKIELNEKFGCQEILVPSNALGGISPNVGIVECRFINRGNAAPGISRKGCRLPLYNKYIVYKDGEFKGVNSAEEFRRFFGPVTTPEEALSFAVALTNSYTDYNVKPPEGYRVYVPKIEDSEVRKVKDYYEVRLFNYQLCGCGSHPYFAVEYKVTKSGEVKEISRQKLYEDPQQDGLCVD
jgi:hypothetical protein